jgi:nitrite reductase (cytochrome c-552)
MLKKFSESIKSNPKMRWLLFISVMVGVFLLGLLAASITERRAEVLSVFNNKKVNITGIEAKNEMWGINYPREFETWSQTAEMDFKSKHLGNMKEDLLESRPELVVLWAGYGFSTQYEAPRGHKYALEDIRNSLRTGSPDHAGGDKQPATCWTCKSPDVPRMMHEKGITEFYAGKWSKMGAEIVNPIGCADCHDPVTMNLTITRPGLIEAFERQGKDIKKATMQEMRTLVCAQCHVEYYFKGEGKYLTFPWDKGSTVEDMEKYYDELEYSDWTHKLSRAPMLKAQHPDYEIFMMGPHAKRGLSCADCHMPYKSEGGIKFSDHHIMSPLKNVAGTCQTCHKDSEEKLKGYVYEYQDKLIEIRSIVEKDLAKLHITAKFAWDKGATEAQMKPILQLIRQAQWRWDFVVASHGSSFHAPVESQRIMSHSLDRTHSAMLALQKVLFTLGQSDAPMPDISTKDKAQLYIGLDMKDLNAKKEIFKKTMIPEWLKEARAKKKLITPEN